MMPVLPTTLGRRPFNAPALTRAAMLALVFSFLFLSLINGRFGVIGTDNDDAMRLLQIENFLAGQNWFDVTQYRLGPDGGTAMHWSRLVDAPILILAWAFGVFVEERQALQLAVSVWPPLTFALMLGGLVTGARRLGEAYVTPTVIVTACVFFGYFRFMSGAIDHHNIQMALLALAIGGAVDRQRKPTSLALSGAALALSIAIGGEVYLFAGIICAFIAVDWAIVGADGRRGAIGFGLALTMGLLLSFLFTIRPAAYAAVYCDALSSVSVLAGAVGGLGLAACAYAASGRPFWMRWVCLGLLGVLSVSVLSLYAPQCLSNPMDSLSPKAQSLWLDNVREARGLEAMWAAGPQFVFYALGLCGAGLVASIWGMRHGVVPRAQALFIALLSAVLVLTIYQARFHFFGFLFAVLPLAIAFEAAWRARVKRRSAERYLYLGVLTVASPALWLLAGTMLVTPATAARSATTCFDDQAITMLNDVPPGLVLAPAGFAPRIIADTPHRAFFGNYHRNKKGIEESLDIITANSTEAIDGLRRNGVDYLAYCPDHGLNAVYEQANPQGFWSALGAGAVPAGLTPLATPPGSIHLYRVDPAAG